MIILSSVGNEANKFLRVKENMSSNLNKKYFLFLHIRTLFIVGDKRPEAFAIRKINIKIKLTKKLV